MPTLVILVQDIFLERYSMAVCIYAFPYIAMIYWEVKGSGKVLNIEMGLMLGYHTQSSLGSSMKEPLIECSGLWVYAPLSPML